MIPETPSIYPSQSRAINVTTWIWTWLQSCWTLTGLTGAVGLFSHQPWKPSQQRTGFCQINLIWCMGGVGHYVQVTVWQASSWLCWSLQNPNQPTKFCHRSSACSVIQMQTHIRLNFIEPSHPFWYGSSSFLEIIKPSLVVYFVILYIRSIT